MSSRDHPHHSELLTGSCKEGVHRLELEPFFLYDIWYLHERDTKPRQSRILSTNRSLDVVMPRVTYRTRAIRDRDSPNPRANGRINMHSPVVVYI
jgi:hypothetical protein